MQKIAVPEFDELFGKEIVPHYEYYESLETDGDNGCLIFHTSGSSGNPKPIEVTTKRSIIMNAVHELEPDADGLEPIWQAAVMNQRILNLLPAFHVGIMRSFQ